MTDMVWQPALETGVGQIDEEHRSLVAAMNRLRAAVDRGKDREEIGRTLAFLRDYTVTHFGAEEALMLRHRYPGASAHFAAHADLLCRLSDLVADHRAGRPMAMDTVLAFLESWLVEHILGQDQELGAFLREQGQGA